MAETFVALRSSLGSEYFGLLPTQPTEIATNLEYAHSGEVFDGPVFKAREMEQKWDIYLYNDRIYFCRSWTGMLIYVAEFAISGSKLQVLRVWMPGGLETGGTEFAVRQLDYLIKSHLYGRKVPHPLPNDLSRDPEETANYSFSQYGNMCSFGTFEDTLPADLTKPI